ncbi:PEP-CTERM sorting domain-containing protein [Poriferisphaera sp. WC338]|uniref:PEP-CTERM sorting domain-containing protein n=1 Tax=Poriferisphaera sp. WC338 TaxID=3425129 RepID=UPI003D8143E3
MNVLRMFFVLTMLFLHVNVHNFADAAHHPFKFRHVAMIGDRAPGTEDGVRFRNFTTGGVALDESGQIAFYAKLEGSVPEISLDSGIWYEQRHEIKRIIRRNDAVEGVGGSYTSTSVPMSDGQGGLYFVGNVYNTAWNSGLTSLFWYEKEGIRRPMIREGEEGLPGFLENEYVKKMPSLKFNSSGEAIQTVSYAGGKYWGSGIWHTNQDGERSLIVKQGQQAPGFDEGVTFGNPFSKSGYINDSLIGDDGTVVFNANLVGNGLEDANSLWVLRQDGLEAVAYRDMGAVGVGENMVLGTIGQLQAMSGGQVIYGAYYKQQGSDENIGRGVWRGDGQGSELIVASGDPVIGLRVGESWRMNRFLVGPDDQMMFSSIVTGDSVLSSNNDAIMSKIGDDINLLVREGEDAGLGDSSVFGDLNPFFFNNPYNHDGQLLISGHIIFTTGLRGENVDDDNNAAMFVLSMTGQIELLFREGDLFDVDDDPLVEDMRQISSFQGYTSINSRNEVGVLLRFINGSEGVFVASIPEPGVMGMMLLGGVGVMMRRRQTK